MQIPFPTMSTRATEHINKENCVSISEVVYHRLYMGKQSWEKERTTNGWSLPLGKTCRQVRALKARDMIDSYGSARTASEAPPRDSVSFAHKFHTGVEDPRDSTDEATSASISSSAVWKSRRRRRSMYSVVVSFDVHVELSMLGSTIKNEPLAPELL